jgi:hypothetical protein
MFILKLAKDATIVRGKLQIACSNSTRFPSVHDLSGF